MPKKPKSKTKKFLGIFFIGAGLISLYWVPWLLVGIWLTPRPDTVQEQLDKALDYDLDGIIVYVDKKGQEPEFYAAGWKDKANEIPADPNSLFKIASVEKLYVAVAVNRLMFRGRLKMNASLADCFPSYVGRIENAETITLNQIITHTSGIPNFTNFADYWNNPVGSNEEAVELILDQPASFEPGTDYEYSNTNYVLLKMIIDKAVGYSYQQYIREEFLEPLGLSDTYFSLDEIDMDRLMSGYYVGIERDMKTTDYGSMIATAEDLGIFLRALNEGLLFEKNEEFLYRYEYDHTGLIPGYQTIAEYREGEDAVVIQFVNTTNFSGLTWSVGEMVYNKVVKIALNE